MVYYQLSEKTPILEGVPPYRKFEERTQEVIWNQQNALERTREIVQKCKKRTQEVL